MVPKFRKKPVVIEAEQFNYGNAETLSDEFYKELCACEDSGNHLSTLYHIHTLEGPMGVSAGDWIIKGLAGEFYACKPEIFHKTYEAAD